MKNILIIVLLFAVAGCDPVSCSEYYIFNNTNRELLINFYESDSVTVSYRAQPGNDSLFVEACSMGGARLWLALDDSIIVYENDIPIIKYYPMSSLPNNIYETENGEVWVEKRINHERTKYVYTLSEEDLM